MKIFTACLLLFSTIALAEDIPDRRAPNMREVLGVVSTIEEEPTSIDPPTVNAESMPPVIGLIDFLFRFNHFGYPVYDVEVSDKIRLKVASRETFKTGDCVVVWYMYNMGDEPDLSRLGEAGIAKSSACENHAAETAVP